MAIFKKINFGLSKTRNKMAGAIDDMLDSFDSFEDDLYTELEEILVMADVGVTTAVQVVEELKERVKSEKIKKTSEVKKELQNIIADLLYGGEDMGLITMPSVILVIGVNGAGKTTTIGKMSAMYKAQGKKVILGAADTFRAAAIDQLDVWAGRANVDIIKHKEGADPAAVVYDTIQAGIARNCDIIIIDTAGRLHNKKNLMDELNKIYRVMDKELPYADREILLVLDATTGQNGVNQAREFANVAELTGIVLTKLDGTARGGVVLSIKNELKLPVKFIGVGEAIDDLQPFDPAAFAKSLFVEAGQEDDKDENSLEGLINSEDYRSYRPDSGDSEDSEGVRALLEEVFSSFGESDENGADSQGHAVDETGAVPGQENGTVAPKGAEEAEKTAKAPATVQKKASDNSDTESEGNLAERQAALLKQEAERKASEEKAKQEAERIAAEEKAKQEAERIAAEEKAKKEAERKAAEEKAKQEAERKAAEEKAKQEAERKAAEEKAKQEEKEQAERIAKAMEETEENKAARAAAEKAAEMATRMAAQVAAAAKTVPVATPPVSPKPDETDETDADSKPAEPVSEAQTEKKKERKGLFGLFGRHS